MSAQLAQAEATRREGIRHVEQNTSSTSAPTVYITHDVAVEVQHVMHLMQHDVLQRLIMAHQNTSHIALSQHRLLQLVMQHQNKAGCASNVA